MKREMRKDLDDIVLHEYGNDFEKFMRAEVLNTDFGSTRDFIEELYNNDLYMDY